MIFLFTEPHLLTTSSKIILTFLGREVELYGFECWFFGYCKLAVLTKLVVLTCHVVFNEAGYKIINIISPSILPL